MLSDVRNSSASERAGTTASWRAMLFICMLSLLASVASASVLPLKLEEMIAVSDAVVAVRVKQVESAPVSGRIQTTAKFDVLESFKGKLTGEQEITYLGGRLGSLVMEAPGQPKLVKGQETILFLSRPYDRYPKSVQAKFNVNSPMVSGYSIVGGKLGKLSLVKADGTENTERKDTEALPGDLRVVRIAEYGSSPKTADVSPTLDEFRTALTGLVKAHESKLAQKGPEDQIVGVYGKFAVPEKSASALVRLFDPLPEMAYMNDEELKQLNEKVWEEQAKKTQSADETTSDQPGN